MPSDPRSGATPADILAPLLRAEPFRTCALVLDGTGIPLTSLRDRDRLEAILARFAASQRVTPGRALASLWLCRYLAVVLPHAVLALALAGWRFPIDAPVPLLRIDGRAGQPVALVLAGMGGACAEPLDVTLTPFLEAYLQPLVVLLEEITGLPRQVAWSNLASLLEHCARYALRQGAGAGRVEPLLAWTHPDWARIGTLGDFIGQAADGRRRRRICCLCFELGGAWCLDCPARLPAKGGCAG